MQDVVRIHMCECKPDLLRRWHTFANEVLQYFLGDHAALKACIADIPQPQDAIICIPIHLQ